MGSGTHGGFGETFGAKSVISADATLVGNGKGFELKDAAKKMRKVPGYTDVVVHGTPNSIVITFIKDDTEKTITLDHRRLAKYLKHSKGYEKGNIRLIACKTGSDKGSFAQNLANKMGVTVRAPTDTVYIYPNGGIVIGPDMLTNTGKWVDYHPKRKR